MVLFGNRAPGSKRSLTPVALGLLLLSGGAAGARSEVYRVRLEGAGRTQLAQELTRALGVPVEVAGEPNRPVSLDLTLNSPGRILDRVAFSGGGTWRLKLRITEGRNGTVRTPVLPLEQNVAVGVQDVPASRAFALVADQLKAELELAGALRGRVALLAVNVPASVVLDRLSEQAGASWSIAYRLDFPDPPPAPAPLPREPVTPAAEERRLPDPSGVPAPPGSAPEQPVPASVEEAPSAVALRAQLWEGLQRVVRTDPRLRNEAVRGFIHDSELVFARLETLPAIEQLQRTRASYTVLPLWMRLYKGLAPSVQKELEPVTRFLEQHLRVR